MCPSIEDDVTAAHLSIGDPIIGFFRTAKESGEINTEAIAETLFQMLQALVLYFLREETDSSTAVAKTELSTKTLVEGLHYRNKE